MGPPVQCRSVAIRRKAPRLQPGLAWGEVAPFLFGMGWKSYNFNNVAGG
jgi:hypothetical protein